MRAGAGRDETCHMTTPTHFEAFTPTHLAIIAGFLVVCVAVAVLGRSHRGTPSEVRFRRGFALLIPCFTIPLQVLQFLPAGVKEHQARRVVRRSRAAAQQLRVEPGGPVEVLGPLGHLHECHVRSLNP